MTALSLRKVLMSSDGSQPPAETPPGQAAAELQAIYDGMLDGLLLADIETKRLLQANPAACRMFGYSAEEMTRLSVPDLHPAAEVPQVMESFQLLIREPLRRRVNHPCARKDGTVFHADISSSLLRYRGRDCVVGFFRDVTEAREIKEALARSEASLKRLFEHIPDFVIVVDQDAAIRSANHASPIATVDELIGQSGLDLLHPDSREIGRQALRAAFETRQVQQAEVLGKSGIWYCSRVVPVLEEGEVRTAMIISTDITARRKAEEALQKEQDLIRHLLELAERDREVVAFEIHDGFAQQLAGAKMQFEASARLQQSNPAQARKTFDMGLQLLHEGIQESRRLVSGLRPPVLDAFGVVPAIEHLILQDRTPEGPEIELAVEVQFDRLARPLENAVFRIVQESLTNALKHSRSPKVRVHLADDGQRVYVTVRDWGVGFDPDRVAEGHFGLRGIRERARLLDGRATIESTPGGGTTIRVELPLVPQESG
jgi:PAS domain S-box-containing protein